MLAVVKTPRTNLRICGYIPAPVLKALRHEYGTKLTLTTEVESTELENVFETDLYKEFKNRIKPSDYVRTYRENAELSQAELGERLGVSRAYVCDIEHERRAISKQFAQELSEFFKISVSRFI